jgi:hypothetical protein
MALRKTIQITGQTTVHDGQITVPGAEQTVNFDAYIKVESIRSTKSDASVLVSFNIGESSFERVYGFTPSMDGGNFIKQAYEYIKALPEFEGAEDC